MPPPVTEGQSEDATTTGAAAPDSADGNRPDTPLLLSAVDAMGPAVTVPVDDPLSRAMVLLQTLDVRQLLVLDGERCVGVVDDRAIAYALLAGAGFGSVVEHEVRTVLRSVPHVGLSDSLAHVARTMSDGVCDAVAVLDGHAAVLGLVTAADLVRLLGREDTSDGDGR